MLIDGELVSGTDSFDVLNPADETVLGSAPECSQANLDRAVHAAQEAFRGWRRNIEKRRDVLRRAAVVLRENADPLARLLTQEQGKPLAKARGEIGGSARWFEYTAELEYSSQAIEVAGQRSVTVHHRPLGVVAAIIPWNYPVITAVWKIAPALLAGNTVVLKPSPFTPLATLKMAELLNDVIPRGVLNVVSGGDELGARMTSHPGVRKIAFTGSISTGKAVAAAAAPDLKRITLELGGNDPAIVLPDAVPEAITEHLFRAAFENSGQVCVAIKRVYVPEQLYNRFAEEFARFAGTVKLGNGLDESSELGPVNNDRQFERVLDLIGDVRERGGRIAVGGARHGEQGYFIEPAIATDVPDDARLVSEEQFGPALPLLSYRDVDEAVDRANAGMFGLAASVWGEDTQRASEIGGELECGTVWVNQHLNIVPQVPMGGWKWSGIGVENGIWGLLQFTQMQVVEVA
ncbi:MAG: aldehyde dehydrogenase family protein [Proteobacteria bacterium]|nr:aldehyde dehydrogenase family protein [Pseudomonadota bacterium]